MSDPYSWPDTDCLRNKLGIRDPERFAALEAKIVSVREVEISRETIPGDYNPQHLKTFHGALFGDVYDWAGETRRVDISKPGSRFCHWRFVDDEASAVLAGLANDGRLIGLDNIRACRENLLTADTKLLVEVLDPVVRRI